MKIKLPVINKSPHALPSFQTEGSAGMDLRAWLPEDLTLEPLQRSLVATGLFIALPPGFEAQVRPRSGLAINKGLTLVNSPGTVDADYRGEIKIALINLSGESQIIKDGERIAQMIVARYERIEWEPVEDLEVTERGEGGFGHSGIH